MFPQPTRLDNIVALPLTTDPDMVNDASFLDGVGHHKVILMCLDSKCPCRLLTSKINKDFGKAQYDVINAMLETFLHTHAESFELRTTLE